MKEDNSSEPSLPSTEGKRHLPQPMGPHSVGYIDLDTKNGESGLFVRIYYPTDAQCLEYHNVWPTWSDNQYIGGLISFVQSALGSWPSWAPRNDYKYIDKLQRISPYIPQSIFPKLFKLMNGDVYIPIIPSSTLSRKKSWPLMVFSHGLGCAPFIYSRICYDIASFGFIVAAVEHRDGSACYTLPYVESSDSLRNSTGIPYRRLDTKDDEYMVRNEQVKYRSEEVKKTLDLLLDLNSGIVNFENIAIFKNNCKPKDKEFLSSFKNSMDTKNATVSGHSFGGATTLLSLAYDNRFRTGTVFDGWFFSLKNEHSSLFKRISQPVLFINNESFISDENIKMQSKFFEHNSNHKSYCIEGSVHQNHMDTPFLFKDNVIKRMLGMHSKICPELFLLLNNRLHLQFVLKHLGMEKDTDLDTEIDRKKHLLKYFDPKDLSFIRLDKNDSSTNS
uniref:1-alkyl-2-acetylglycerophosphocholine esterase n=1 Tax=Lepeophtheirus salmonis TaxID=72036 RepID=A0A0K2V3Q1_LEPSM